MRINGMKVLRMAFPVPLSGGLTMSFAKKTAFRYRYAGIYEIGSTYSLGKFVARYLGFDFMSGG